MSLCTGTKGHKVSQLPGPCGKACLGWAAAKRYQESLGCLADTQAEHESGLTQGPTHTMGSEPVLGKVTPDTAPSAGGVGRDLAQTSPCQPTQRALRARYQTIGFSPQ